MMSCLHSDLYIALEWAGSVGFRIKWIKYSETQTDKIGYDEVEDGDLHSENVTKKKPG